jgi:hypothetical protein
MIQLTGQPRNCHHRSPGEVTKQNQMKTMKKKIWLMRRVVTMFMIYGSGFWVQGSGFK